jgi:hypothetical protein
MINFNANTLCGDYEEIFHAAFFNV